MTNIKKMEGLFLDCSSLTSIYGMFFGTLVFSAPKFTNSPLTNIMSAFYETLLDVKFAYGKVYYRGNEMTEQIPDLDITDIINPIICNLSGSAKL